MVEEGTACEGTRCHCHWYWQNVSKGHKSISGIHFNLDQIPTGDEEENEAERCQPVWPGVSGARCPVPLRCPFEPNDIEGARTGWQWQQ